MKKVIGLLAVGTFISIRVLSQGVGMGTVQPDSSAALDIRSGSSGLLLPRMNLGSILSIRKPAKGLLVYDSVLNLVMVNLGSARVPDWEPVASTGGAEGAAGWFILGNAGIDPAGQFVGTTDPQPLLFRVNNRPAGVIDPTSGSVFFGLQAGQTGKAGNHTIAIGPVAPGTDTSINDVVAVGDSALTNSTDGAQNTAIGSKALFSNTFGFFNTAAGFDALIANTSGESNVAMGFVSLASNVTGSFNVADGVQALLVNTTGASNVAAGYQALFNSSTGGTNTAIGHLSLFQNLDGGSNTALGDLSLFSNTSGLFNTAFGDSALFTNNTGSNNTAYGHRALAGNTTGRGNTAIGERALLRSGAASENVAIGLAALLQTDGVFNTAIGTGSLDNAGTAFEDVALGVLAMNQVHSGAFGDNTAIGAGAAANVDLRSENTAVGAGAALIQDGIRDISVGVFSKNNFLNDEIVLGSSSTTSIGGAVNFSKLSDGRFKRNVREDVRGTAFIMKLRPVTYQVDMAALNERGGAPPRGLAISGLAKTGVAKTGVASDTRATDMVHSGFIAQEVEKAAGDLGYDFNGIVRPQQAGSLYALRYETFVVPLVKAVQEQQQVIEDLRLANSNLEGRLEAIRKSRADRKALIEAVQIQLAGLESSLEKK